MKSFYNNITIKSLILRIINKLCIFLCYKAIYVSYIYSQQNKYCIKMKKNILKKKKKKTLVMSLAKTKQNKIIYPKTKVRQKIPHFF